MWRSGAASKPGGYLVANHPRLQDEALDYCRSVPEDDPSNAYVVAWAINRNMAADLTLV